jgi:hypothetical protein
MKLKICVAAFAAFTAIHPAWIELLGFDPDHGNGALETMLVVVAILVVVALGATQVVRRRGQ